jgi:MYXO-CTERM domain-containing protein
VTFVPQGEGAASGTLSVTTDAAPAVRQVALNGQGEAKPDLTSGGCSLSQADSPSDPTLWALVAAALIALALRQRQRRDAKKART